MILNSIFSQFKIIGPEAVIPVLLSLAERTGGYRTLFRFISILLFIIMLFISIP